LSFAHDGDAGDDDCGEWFVVGVAFNACDRAYEQNRVCIAKTKDGVFSVELRDGLLCDEELATVGAATGGSRARVGHGEEAGLVKRRRDTDDRRRVWVELVPSAHRKMQRLQEPIVTEMRQVAQRFKAEELAIVRDFMREAKEVFQRQVTDAVKGQVADVVKAKREPEPD